MKKFLLIGLCFVALLSKDALAGVPVQDTLDLFEKATTQFQAKAIRMGGNLLFTLLGLQLLINGIKKLITPSEMEGLVKAFVMPLITTAFFVGIITMSGKFLPAIIDDFHGMGQTAAGVGKLTPGQILIQGIMLAEDMKTTFKEKIGESWWDTMKNIFPSMFLLFIQIVVVVSYVILAMQMALAIIGGYLWYCVTPILLGFGGLSYTRDMALTALKGGIAIGMKILVIYLVSSVAEQMGNAWGALLGDVSLENTAPFWIVGSGCAILAYLSFQIPKLASDLLNGQSSLSAGDAASNTMMGMAGLAAAGAGAMAAGAAMKQAGGAAVATLGGLANAVGAGMNSAADLGKTGMDAAGHVAKEVAGHGASIIGGGARNMVENVTSGVRDGISNSFGGQVGQSIEASRGGSMSPTSSSSSNLSNTAASGSSSSSNSSNTAPSGTSDSGPSSGGGTGSGNNSASSTGSGNSSSTLTGDSGMGNATNAALTPGGGGSPSSATDPLAERLDKLTSAMEGGNQASTSDKIRDLAGFVPNDQATVGVNSNFGHSGGEE